MAKRFYAVQHGDDYSSDNGSTNYREAKKIARELHKDYPGEEIRIVFCTTDDDFCEREEVIFVWHPSEEKHGN